MDQKIRVFFGILNWGLGHATRCIPIIKELIQRDFKIFLGSDGEALQFLKKEFPELEILELPSYQVRYPYENMTLNMAIQLPGFLNTIRKEHLLTRKIVLQYKLDAIISDNRYGLYSNGIPSVFISHQTNILVGNKLLNAMVNELNLNYLKKFSRIWIPDFNGLKNLSGELGHQRQLPSIRFIGPLSRLVKSTQKIEYDIVAVLSGPEPQRTKFERKLILQLSKLNLKMILVQGKPGLDAALIHHNDNLKILSFADANTLSGLIEGADLFISRSGYSTIMDLAKLGAKNILFVPTPGQTEQEYLAKNMLQKGYAQVQKQSELNVIKAWEEKKADKTFIFESKSNLLNNAIDDFIKFIQSYKKIN